MSKYIDPEMIITEFREKAYKKVEEILLDDIYKVTMELGTYVDKKKLKQWLEMCAELDKIDESERISDAIREKFKEKDKEIEELKQDYDLCKLSYDLKCSEFDKLCYDYNNLRHQVCEEIRAFFDVNEYAVNWDYLNEILDQIEKGE